MIADVAALRAMSLEELRAHWCAHCRGDTPLHGSRDLLLRAIIFQQEAAKSAGAVRRAHRKLDTAINSPVGSAPLRLSPGTVLVREWSGAAYAVTVTDDGFLWEARRFSSLSAVASAITGVRWSGTRFFKLTEAAQEKAP